VALYRCPAEPVAQEGLAMTKVPFSRQAHSVMILVDHHQASHHKVNGLPKVVCSILSTTPHNVPVSRVEAWATPQNFESGARMAAWKGRTVFNASLQ